MIAQQYVPFKVDEGESYYNVKTASCNSEVYEQVLPFYNNISLFKKNGKWGGKDANLNDLIKSNYDTLEYLSNHLLRGKENENVTLFTTKGTLVTNEKLIEIELLKNSDNLIVVSNEEHLFGIIDSKGNDLIDLVYTTPPFHLNDNLLMLSKVSKDCFNYGVVSMEGKVIIPFKYEGIRLYGNYIIASKIDKTGEIFSMNGEKICEILYPGDVSFISDHFIIYNRGEQSVVQPRKKPKSIHNFDAINANLSAQMSGMIGESPVIINSQGKLIHLTGAAVISRFQNGLAMVKSQDGSSKLVDGEGATVFTFDGVINQWDRNLALVTTKTHTKQLYIIKTGKILSPKPSFVPANLQPNGFVFGNDSAGKKMLIDGKGAIVKVSEFTGIRRESYKENWFKLEFYNPEVRRRTYGILSWSGKELVPSIYYEVRSMKEGRDKYLPFYQIRTYENGLYDAKLIDTMGVEIIPFGVYSFIQAVGDNFITFKNKKINSVSRSLKGMCDWTGKSMIPCKYDKILKIEENGAYVNLNGRQGYCSFDGIEIIPPEYEKVEMVGDYFIVSKWSRFGILDLTGKEVIPLNYINISYKKNDLQLFKATLDKEEFFINLKGDEFRQK